MRFCLQLLTSIVAMLLTACGGGGSSQVAEGGIGGTGVSQGKVSGYGSLFVNGVEFQTDTANFIIEETSGYNEQSIKLGMVVQVTGEHGDVAGSADTVSYGNQMQGILTDAPALDINGNGSLAVMRQTVNVNQTTIFEDTTGQDLLITDLLQNDLVEISGFSDGTGTVYATRVELVSRNWTPGTTLSIKGIVTNLGASQFDIGGLTIDYSMAASLPDGPPVAGAYVEAKGSHFDSISNQFLAEEVELEGDGSLEIASDGEQVTVEGVVTSALSADLFSLNGQWVSVANLAAVDASQFTLGRGLEVNGIMAGGILEAREITFQATDAEIQEMAHFVESVQVDATNSGTLTLYGKTLSITPTTLMKDDLGDDRLFTLSAVSNGDYVEVDLYIDGNALVGLKLERESAPSHSPAEIEGLVQEVDVNGVPTHIRVLDVLIDISGTGINPAVADRVDIMGNYDGTILSASEAEIEN